MDLINAIKSIIRPHEEDVLTPLRTEFSKDLTPENVLGEYPRPQLVRESYFPLNGMWEYAFTDGKKRPNRFDGEILVPFSPETALSGVGRQLKPGEYLWYRLKLPAEACAAASGERILLHFQAVDYEAEVCLNGEAIYYHEGGYLPFCVDLTDRMQRDGENVLELCVRDDTECTQQTRGKQKLARGGIFYTAQSGIWQSVFIEHVPANYIENLFFETEIDSGLVTLRMRVRSSGTATLQEQPFSVKVFAEGDGILDLTGSPTFHTLPGDSGEGVADGEFSFFIPREQMHLWSPEHPFLYTVEILYGEDAVTSYFAMRQVGIEKKPEYPIPVFCLNHEPYFLMGVLDQGYWPESLYTAPSDEALIFDINEMKKLGFNMLRKHIKVESARFYYHCDRLGMIVCQDMVSGGGHPSMLLSSYLPTLSQTACRHIRDNRYKLFKRADAHYRRQWEEECIGEIDYLRFFPSIAIWCPFNEGWGQFDAARITEMVHRLDSTRPIDSTSGWFDQGCGDFVSVHNYFRKLKVPREHTALRTLRDNSCLEGRAAFLSEYGGLACRIEGHSSLPRIYGYKRFDTVEEFREAYRRLMEESLMPLREQGLSAAVYTQLSDVEEEVNGLLTYDRRVNKIFH